MKCLSCGDTGYLTNYATGRREPCMGAAHPAQREAVLHPGGPNAAATAAQPRPKGQGPEILPLVIADLEARTALGRAKYGEVLRAANGRDALVDAYQEVLDLAQYLRQEIEERRSRPATTFPVIDARWVVQRCVAILAAGVQGGAEQWAAGLRDLRDHAQTAIELSKGGNA